jgi:hypothetical protein
MFTHLTNLTKSIWFYIIAFAPTLALSLASGQLGVVLLVHRTNRQLQALAGA